MVYVWKLDRVFLLVVFSAFFVFIGVLPSCASFGAR